MRTNHWAALAVTSCFTFMSASALADEAEPTTGDAGSKEPEAAAAVDGGAAEKDAGDEVPDDPNLDVAGGNAQCVPTLQDLEEACHLAGGVLKNCKCVKPTSKPDAGIGKGEDKGKKPKAKDDNNKYAPQPGKTCEAQADEMFGKPKTKVDGMEKRLWVLECLATKGHNLRKEINDLRAEIAGLKAEDKRLDGEITKVRDALNEERKKKGEEPIPAPAPKDGPGASAPGDDGDLATRVTKTEERVKVLEDTVKRFGKDPGSSDAILKSINEAIDEQKRLNDSLDHTVQLLREEESKLALRVGTLEKQYEQLRKDHDDLVKRVDGLEAMLKRFTKAARLRVDITPINLQGRLQMPVYQGTTIVRSLGQLNAGIGGGVSAGTTVADIVYLAGGFDLGALSMWDWARDSTGEGFRPGYRLLGGLHLDIGAAAFPYVTGGVFMNVGVQGHDALPNVNRLTAIPIEGGGQVKFLVPVNENLGFTIAPYISGGGDVYSTKINGRNWWGVGPVGTLGVKFSITFGAFGLPEVQGVQASGQGVVTKLWDKANEGKVKPSKVTPTPETEVQGDQKTAMVISH